MFNQLTLGGAQLARSSCETHTGIYRQSEQVLRTPVYGWNQSAIDGKPEKSVRGHHGQAQATEDEDQIRTLLAYSQ